MTSKTLFLGNGLNRTLQTGFSWSDLMKRLGSDEPDDAGVPFPVEFELIAAKRGCMVGRRGQDPYKQLRTDIARYVSEMGNQPGEMHLRYAMMPFDHVVTTNYDQIFESAFRDLKSCITNPGSPRNVLGPIFRSGSVDFYHAHGIDKWKGTLCLGHEHYASLIGKIRTEFYPGGEDKNEQKNDHLNDLITGKIGEGNIWPEYLLTNDVAIVGFDMGYCESDIWWLLALRAALFSPHNHMAEYENQITYYKPEVGESRLSVQDSCRLKAMEALGVIVERVSADNYRDAYVRIAESIESSWFK